MDGWGRLAVLDSDVVQWIYLSVWGIWDVGCHVHPPKKEEPGVMTPALFVLRGEIECNAVRRVERKWCLSKNLMPSPVDRVKNGWKMLVRIQSVSSAMTGPTAPLKFDVWRGTFLSEGIWWPVSNPDHRTNPPLKRPPIFFRESLIVDDFRVSLSIPWYVHGVAIDYPDGRGRDRADKIARLLVEGVGFNYGILSHPDHCAVYRG